MPAMTVLLVPLAYFMVTLDSLVVLTALPSIHRQFGGSLSTLQWTVSAYNMTYAAGILTAAALGDRLGRRRVFLAGLLLFAIASALCAVAPDAATLIAFRTVQGLGAAAVMPTGLTLLTSAFPPERGAVVGIWGGVAGLGVATGPLIGGAVTEGLSWHWIFWVNVPVGLLVAFAVRRRASTRATARAARSTSRVSSPLRWRSPPWCGPSSTARRTAGPASGWSPPSQRPRCCSPRSCCGRGGRGRR